MLLELKLLEGAMLKNKNLNFISKFQNLKVISNNNKFLSKCSKDEVLNIPIAHGEGNYYADEKTIKGLEENDQIILKYCDETGNITNESNPNGSVLNIAGICDKDKKIFGLMPHPERACEEILGGSDGVKMLKGFLC